MHLLGDFQLIKEENTDVIITCKLLRTSLAEHFLKKMQEDPTGLDGARQMHGQ